MFLYCLNNVIMRIDSNGNVSVKKIFQAVWSGVSKFYGIKSEENGVNNPVEPIDKVMLSRQNHILRV